MKKTLFVMALAVVLVFALAATALATSAKTWNYQADYYSWGSVSGNGIMLGDPALPSATATVTLGMGGTGTIAQQNTNVANPGVHANYQTTTAKCGICHSVHRAKAGGVKLLNTSTATCAGCHIAGTATVTNVVIAWGTVAAPLAGPHSSSNGSCTDRACHATSPHGAGGSNYPLFRSKLLTAAVDAAAAPAIADPTNSGVTASVLAGTDADVAGMDAVRVGYTCNSEGCHEQSQLPVIKAGWAQNREDLYPLGNVAGNQKMKTGHMTGTAATSSHAFAPVSSCVSCHDQTDVATRTGYTFPHAQKATGGGAGGQTYLWYNISDKVGGTDIPMSNSNMKSFDGACLKCHVDSAGTSGVGKTF